MDAAGGGGRMLDRATRRACSVGAVLLCIASVGWAAPDDLALYMPFDELEEILDEQWPFAVQAWSVPDQSSYGHYCIVNGGPVEVGRGRRGGALEARGLIDAQWSWTYEGMPRDAISVLFWHRLDEWWLVMPLFPIPYPGPVHDDLYVGACPAGVLTQWWMQSTGGARHFALTSDRVEGRWSHYAATYDPAEGIARLYTDGALADEASDATAMPGEDGYWGRFDSSSSKGHGLVDDLCIWKRALTAEEVRTVMDYGPLALATAVAAQDKAATTWGRLKASHVDEASE